MAGVRVKRSLLYWVYHRDREIRRRTEEVAALDAKIERTRQRIDALDSTRSTDEVSSDDRPNSHHHNPG
jgi:hypothetical protein